MTSMLTSDCVSDYVLPTTGIVPSVFLEGGAQVQSDTIVARSFPAVYSQGLIGDIASTVSKIQTLLNRVLPSRTAVETFVEAPDNASYDDVYAVESVTVAVYQDDSVPDLYDDEPEVWR